MAEQTTYEDEFVRVYHTALAGNLVAERKSDGEILALWDDEEELFWWAQQGSEEVDEP